MELFNTILLDVWREACRHIQITESLPSITAMLIEHLPLHQVVIRRIDSKNLDIHTIAAGVPGCAEGICHTTSIPGHDINALSQWAAKKKLLRDTGHAANNMRRLLLPCADRHDIAAAPLHTREKTAWFIVFVAKQGAAFEKKHIDMIRILMEPFTIAVNNHCTITEMITLREAAEADKKTLLAKLSRKQMGDTIIGADKGLNMVMKRVSLISGSDIPVLIFGETGSGKELIARAIHKTSGRPSGPFIRVNCGAIPPELIDSQLFGHEKGAFTGAVSMKKGRFEIADNGTLFLDEIGELSLDLQVKLLRVLQERVIERVGGVKPVSVNIRLIAATNKSLKEEVARGSFREDLFYRLNVVPITLPPLRERLEDIRPLVSHFIDKYSDERNTDPPVTGIDREVERLFYEYDWPGNVRELENVIERAIVMSPEAIVQVSDLPKDFVDNAHGTLHMDGIPLDANLYDTLALVERNMIIRALKKANYVQTHAAELLGIGKSGLNQKIKKYKLLEKIKGR